MKKLFVLLLCSSLLADPIYNCRPSTDEEAEQIGMPGDICERALTLPGKTFGPDPIFKIPDNQPGQPQLAPIVVKIEQKEAMPNWLAFGIGAFAATAVLSFFYYQRQK